MGLVRRSRGRCDRRVWHSRAEDRTVGWRPIVVLRLVERGAHDPGPRRVPRASVGLRRLPRQPRLPPAKEHHGNRCAQSIERGAFGGGSGLSRRFTHQAPDALAIAKIHRIEHREPLDLPAWYFGSLVAEVPSTTAPFHTHHCRADSNVSWPIVDVILTRQTCVDRAEQYAAILFATASYF